MIIAKASIDLICFKEPVSNVLIETRAIKLMSERIVIMVYRCLPRLVAPCLETLRRGDLAYELRLTVNICFIGYRTLNIFVCIAYIARCEPYDKGV